MRQLLITRQTYRRWSPDFTRDQQANVIREIIRKNAKQDHITDAALILFAHLELVHLEKRIVCCMSVKKSSGKTRNEQCRCTISSSELASNMHDLWHVVDNAAKYYGDNLAIKIFECSFHFLCSSRHRKTECAEQLTLKWLPLIEQYRTEYALAFLVPGQYTGLQPLAPMQPPQATHGVKPFVLPNGEVVNAGPQERERLAAIMQMCGTARSYQSC